MQQPSEHRPSPVGLVEGLVEGLVFGLTVGLKRAWL
jgi:hypothetical protein